MSELIVTCEKTDRAFNTGRKLSFDDLRSLPPQSRVQMFCDVCSAVHEFQLSAASVCTCGYNCRRDQRDCQLERL